MNNAPPFLVRPTANKRVLSVPYDAQFVVPFFCDVCVARRICTRALTFRLDEAFVCHPIDWLDCVACFLRAVSFCHQSRLSVHVLFHDVWFSRVSEDLFHQFYLQTVVVRELLVLDGFVTCDCKGVSIVQVAQLLDGHPSFVLVDGTFLRRFLIRVVESSVATSSLVSQSFRARCFGGWWLRVFFSRFPRVRPSRTIFPVVDTTLPSTAGTSFCSCSSHPTAVGGFSYVASCARVVLITSRCVHSPLSERDGVLRRVRPTIRLHVPPIVRRAFQPRKRRRTVSVVVQLRHVKT